MKKIEENMSRTVTQQYHSRHQAGSTCPGCKDYKVVLQRRFGKMDVQDVARGSKFQGQYFSCGGENEHDCWHMNFSGGKSGRFYETFGRHSRMELRTLPGLDGVHQVVERTAGIEPLVRRRKKND